MFSVRIVTTDQYMAAPLRGLDVCHSDFRQTAVKKVPVFRLFGSTPSGQKTCMHIHGVFPYLYVPYDGTQPWDRYLHQFAASLDKAINIALGNEHSNTQHVYKVALVSGIPMYGFHEKDQQFLKIYLYNPNLVRRVADLLLGGAVMNKVFQPHESHIQYPLQLFIDYNLYGMNLINVAAVKFRQWNADGNGNAVEENQLGRRLSDPAASHDNSLLDTSRTITLSQKMWTRENIPSDMLLGNDVSRLSTCELEVDVVAADILNRLEVNDNLGTNPGLAALWEDERQRKRDRGESSQITPPQSPVRTDIYVAESHLRLSERLEEILTEQRPYLDSQRSEDSHEDKSENEDNLEGTLASVVEDHLSQLSDSEPSSQDTIICDGNDEGSAEHGRQVPAIVNRDSINQVMLSSQSFVSPEDNNTARHDDSLVEILAALAESGSPVQSQSAAAQVTALEEKDSVLSGVSFPTVADRQEEELEMSQRIWDTDPAEEGAEDKQNMETDMDESWTESQFQEVEKIPQLDGPMDEKAGSDSTVRKRLGFSGPVVSQTQQSFTEPQSNTLTTHMRHPLQYQTFNNVPHNRLASIDPSNSYNTVWNPRDQYEQHHQDLDKSDKGDCRNQWYTSQHGAQHQDYNWGKHHNVNQQQMKPRPQTMSQQQLYHMRQSHRPEYQHPCPVGQSRLPLSYPQEDLGYSHPYYQNNGAIHSTPPDSMNRGHIPTSPPLINSPSPASSSGHGHNMSINKPQLSPLSVESPFHSQQRYGDVHSPPIEPILHSPTSYPPHLSPSSPQLGPGHLPPAWSDCGYPDSRSPAQSPLSSQGFEVHHLPSNQRNHKTPLHKPHSIISSLLTGEGSPLDKMPRYEHLARHSVLNEHSARHSVLNEHSARHSVLNISADSQEDLFADTSSIKSRPRSTSSHSSLSSRSSVCSDHTNEIPMAHISQSFTEGQASWQPQMSPRKPSYVSSGVLSSLEDFVQNVHCDTGRSCESTFSPTWGEDQCSLPSHFTTQPNHSQPSMRPERQLSAPNYVTYEKLLQGQQSYPSNAYPSEINMKSSITVGSGMPSVPPFYPAHVSSCNKPGLASSRGKAGRMRKLGLSLQRHNSLPADPSFRQQSAYSYAFHVPTPVYKRMKMLQKKSDKSLPEVSIVRMHPMDARKYSLLKIGRELAKAKRLSQADIIKIKADLKSKSSTVLPSATVSNLSTSSVSDTNLPDYGRKQQHVSVKEHNPQPMPAGEKKRRYTAVHIRRNRKTRRKTPKKLKPVKVKSQSPRPVKIRCRTTAGKRKSETELLLEITGPDGSTCFTRGGRKKVETTQSVEAVMDVKAADNPNNSVIEGCNMSVINGQAASLSTQEPATLPIHVASSQPVECLEQFECKDTASGEILSSQNVVMDVAEGQTSSETQSNRTNEGRSGEEVFEPTGKSEGNSTSSQTCTDNTKVSKELCVVGDDRNNRTTIQHPINNLSNAPPLNKRYPETSRNQNSAERSEKKLINDVKYPPMSVYGGNLPPSMAMYATVEPISSEEEDDGKEMLSIPKVYTQPYNRGNILSPLSMYETDHYPHIEPSNSNALDTTPTQPHCSEDPPLYNESIPCESPVLCDRGQGIPSDRPATASVNPETDKYHSLQDKPEGNQPPQLDSLKPTETFGDLGDEKDLPPLIKQCVREEMVGITNTSDVNNGKDTISCDSAPLSCMPVLKPMTTTCTKSKSEQTKNNRRLSLKKRQRRKSSYFCDDFDEEDDEEDVYMAGDVKQQTLQWAKGRTKRSSANYDQNAFTHLLETENIDDTGSDDDFKTSRASKRCTKRNTPSEENLKEGVHFIVVGKFKGYKSMVVSMGNDHIDQSPVNAEKYLQTALRCKTCQRVRNRKAQAFEQLSKNASPYDSGKESTVIRQGQTASPVEGPVVTAPDSNPTSNSNSDSNVDNDPELKDDSSCDAVYGKNRQRSRKRTLTRNQRLGVAFLTKKAKRKRPATPTSCGSVMNSLSLLHQATLANLTDIAAYTDKCEEEKMQYEDVLHKLALVSPPSSDKEENSPPQPVSPGSGSQEVSANKKEDSTRSKPDSQGIDKSATIKSSPPCLAQTSFDSPYDPPLPCVDNMSSKEALKKSPANIQSGISDTDVSNQSMPHLGEEKTGSAHDETKSASEQVSKFLIKKDHPFLLKRTKFKIPSKYLQSVEKTEETNKPTLSPPDLGPPNIPRYNTTTTTKLSDIQPPSLYCNRLSASDESDKSNSDAEDQVAAKQNSTGEKSEEMLAENSKLRKEGFVKMLDFSRNVTCRLSQEEQNSKTHDVDNSNKEDLTKTQSAETMEQYPVHNGTCSYRNMDSIHHNVTASKTQLHISKSQEDRYASFQHEHRPPQLAKKPIQYLETGLSAKDLFKLTQGSSEKSRVLGTRTHVDDARGFLSQRGFGEETRHYSSHSTLSRQAENILTAPQSSGNTLRPWEKSSPDNRNVTTSPCWRSSSMTGPGRTVITPLLHPPSFNSVKDTAGLYEVEVREPFCSNPVDIPERPREIAGRVLKLNSNMPGDLEEFVGKFSGDGLKTWRQIVTEEHPVFSQQTVNSSFIHRLETDEQLKYAIIGDKCKVISPCSPPPSYSTVQKWLKQKCSKKDLDLKMDNHVQKTRHTDVRVIVESEIDSCVHMNPVSQDWNPESLNPPVLKELPALETPMKGSYLDDKDEDASSGPLSSTPSSTSTDLCPHKNLAFVLSQEMKPSSRSHSPLNSKLHVIQEGYKDKEENCHSELTKTCQDSDNLAPKQSTPVKWTSSNKLIKLPCTPINAPHNKDGSPSLGGPKRCPLKRRLSTGTQTSLRRSLLASQLQNLATPGTSKGDVSQIDGPTPKNTFGFRFSQNNAPDSKALHEIQYLTVLSLEVHVETRGDRKPDPDLDQIQAIFYSISNDIPPEEGRREITGAILVNEASASLSHSISPGTNTAASDIKAASSTPQPSPSKLTLPTSKLIPQSPQPSTSKATPPEEILPSISSHEEESSKPPIPELDSLLQRSGVSGLEVTYVKDEQDLIQTFLKLIQRWDPDILVGYEIQMLSLGYLLNRASHLGIDLCALMSRIPESKKGSHMSAEKDEFGADYMSEIHISGRIVLNLWRVMKHEVTLNQYSFENVAFHVLHQRVPHYSHRSLTNWFNHRTHLYRWRVVDYYVTRVKGNHDIMEQLNLIGRTSEFARVFGIEFYHVLSRGSQYRVESMMLRLAKPLNFIAVSPSVHQRARMKSPECIPLTLEPESRFYTHPVVVLDFQSLYPSIMIAYNYCFSTCLGRLENLSKAQDGAIEFGCTSLSVSPSLLRKLKDDVTFAPNGVAFVKQHVRKGVISSMVEEILNTRIMVKKEMKSYKNDKGLSRLLHARQLGLKLIANVTYGYTAANFSGRMPCIEVGDSIVHKARETLEKAIALVQETPQWRARVVYGDTDSMFIELEGRSKDEAFQIGQEIADAVTAINPKPIKLKFEKVYLPCVLQTKKRYFGYMYETRDQKEAVFDAKGIETVRRDNCPAVSKMLEKCIKILFTTRDVSLIKQYVLKQCVKLLQGRVSVQDCIFAKEYRGMPGYKPGACVPALEIAKKRIRHDRRSEPRVGERVPYVIVYGSPGLPLIQLVREPMELLQDSSLRLNTTYYITKQILPPLDRFLALLGVNVFTWYQEMPRIVKVTPAVSATGESKKGTISQYFSVTNCPVCDEQTKLSICCECQKDPQTVVVTLNQRIQQWEKTHQHLLQMCSSCMGVKESNVSCVSLDCPILYRLNRASQDKNKSQQIRDILTEAF